MFHFAVDPEKVRVRIRQLRLKLGLTQDEVAARSGINEKHYQDLETGRKAFNPTLETLNALATTFEIPLAALLTPQISQEE
jgi:transcriptional regulator with XRE-family HTH domain